MRSAPLPKKYNNEGKGRIIPTKKEEKKMNKGNEKLGDYIKRARGTQTARSISEESRAMYPKDEERQISLSYLARVEQGLGQDINPKKLQTLATILNIDYYEILRVAGYMDNYQAVERDMKEDEKIIDVNHILTDPNVTLQFSGNPIEENKKEALLAVLKLLAQE